MSVSSIMSDLEPLSWYLRSISAVDGRRTNCSGPSQARLFHFSLKSSLKYSLNCKLSAEAQDALGEGDRRERPRAIEAAAVRVAATDSVRARQRDDLLVVEAHLRGVSWSAVASIGPCRSCASQRIPQQRTRTSCGCGQHPCRRRAGGRRACSATRRGGPRVPGATAAPISSRVTTPPNAPR